MIFEFCSRTILFSSLHCSASPSSSLASPLVSRPLSLQMIRIDATLRSITWDMFLGKTFLLSGWDRCVLRDITFQLHYGAFLCSIELRVWGCESIWLPKMETGQSSRRTRFVIDYVVNNVTDDNLHSDSLHLSNWGVKAPSDWQCRRIFNCKTWTNHHNCPVQMVIPLSNSRATLLVNKHISRLHNLVPFCGIGATRSVIVRSVKASFYQQSCLGAGEARWLKCRKQRLKAIHYA